MIGNLQSIQQGWDVVGNDGDKIGEVAGLGQDYILVQKGWLFTKDLYVPTSAVASLEDGRVYLNHAKNEIESMGWEQAPTEMSGSRQTTATDDFSASNDEIVTSQATAGTGYAAEAVYEQPIVETQQVQTQPVQATTADTQRIQRHEEELTAQKTVREAGEVQITKDVIEEQRTLQVPVTREEVVINRVPVSDTGQSSHPNAFQGETIEVPIREEQVQVTKTPRVVEELEIQKVATQETQQVSDTVRREVFDIDQEGQVQVDGQGLGGTTNR